MDGTWVSAYPEHIRNGELRDPCELAQGSAQEQRHFLPLLEKKIQEPVLFSMVCLHIRCIDLVAGTRTLPKDELVGDGFGLSLFEIEADRAQEIGKTNGVGDAQREDFLDVAWRG